jgi:hypothetical protein
MTKHVENLILGHSGTLRAGQDRLVRRGQCQITEPCS